MDTIDRVRRLQIRGKKSEREIARLAARRGPGGVRQGARTAGVLAGGLSEPGRQDAVQCPYALLRRAGWRAGAFTTT